MNKENILEYMDVMNEIVDDKDSEIKKLREKVASANVKVEKQAATNKTLATIVVDKLVELGAVKDINKEASVSSIEREPEKVLDYMIKLASVKEVRKARTFGNIIDTEESNTKNGSEADRKFTETFRSLSKKL
jgi:hypothetical protein